MNSDLIVMSFSTVEGGGSAGQAIGILRDRQTLGLEYTAIVTKTGAGQPVIHHRQRLPIRPHEAEWILLERLADELFGCPLDEATRTLVIAGMDRLFVERVAKALGPDSSALMIYIPSDSMADVEQLVEVLALLEGTVHRTTLPTQVEEALLR